ncbi:Glycoside hydrolase, superfamily [Penicillium griseofulvum]|uniref:Glycoside hydrolase, superfamily n=1 Tax=Penicillium patulum TaxID=5078 RepID=A0A135LM76_PENPA|nr:Glycoside hydrolase, superfamily [Penicillium griseofulvum]KXG50063.1 Glycoside hydrolase, superfamily [Penicillium griseofulvum]
MFARSGNIVVGVYSGAEVQKASSARLIETFQDNAESGITVFETCAGLEKAAQTFGLFAGSVVEMDQVQDAVKIWADANCLDQDLMSPLDGIEMDILVSSIETSNDGGDLHARAACRDIEDGCWAIADAFGITELSIENNNLKTWGWAGCGQLQAGQVICISKGTPPFPSPVENTICGPRVPGTKKPAAGTDIATLNPCPLKACCDVLGWCGVTSEFCTPTPADTGAPGTAKPDTNGCISNCGTKITNNAKAPASSRRVGYFEAWNAKRKCLHMDVTELANSDLTHIHFAFAIVTPD